MKICSLLPAATEMLYALGLSGSVVAVTSECDYPPEAAGVAAVVRSRLSAASESAEIDRQVRDFADRGEGLYEIDQESLKAIEPDLIVTQDLCRVCAPASADVRSLVEGFRRPPQLVSLNAQTLAGVAEDVRTLGAAKGEQGRAEQLIREFDRRLTRVEQAVADLAPKPRVACLEWLDPLFVAGHWVPEMVELAGGIDALGKAGAPAFRTTWNEVLRAEPEVILIMPCGYHLDSVVEELNKLALPEGWSKLPAVREGRVYAVDASSYFSRPGLRLATGVEIMASIFHPVHAPAGPPAASVEPWKSSGLSHPKAR